MSTPQLEYEVPKLTVNLIDYYAVMGVEITATQEEIRSVYLDLKDLYAATDRPRYHALQDAYIVLGDREERAKYDRKWMVYKDYPAQPQQTCETPRSSTPGPSQTPVSTRRSARVSKLDSSPRNTTFRTVESQKSLNPLRLVDALPTPGPIQYSDVTPSSEADLIHTLGSPIQPQQTPKDANINGNSSQDDAHPVDPFTPQGSSSWNSKQRADPSPSIRSDTPTQALNVLDGAEEYEEERYYYTGLTASHIPISSRYSSTKYYHASPPQVLFKVPLSLRYIMCDNRQLQVFRMKDHNPVIGTRAYFSFIPISVDYGVQRAHKTLPCERPQYIGYKAWKSRPF